MSEPLETTEGTDMSDEWNLGALLAIAEAAPRKWPLTPRRAFLWQVFHKTFEPDPVAELLRRLIAAEAEIERLECKIEGVPHE